MIKPISLLAGAVLAALAIPAGATSVSTNPDTPTTLKVNTIVSNTLGGDGKSFDNYYTFQAGPGVTKIRVTLRAGRDAGDVEVSLTDPDGNKLAPVTCPGHCNDNSVIAEGQGDIISSATFQIDGQKTVVMHVHDSGTYYHDGPKPSYRITIDGAVKLNKSGKPLKLTH